MRQEARPPFPIRCGLFPSTVGFDAQVFAEAQGGFLASYLEQMTRGATPAAMIINDLGLEYSINPRILLSLMEFESGWVTGKPDEFGLSYPFGWEKRDRTGIYFQSAWQFSNSHWVTTAGDGSLTELAFTDGSTSASVALQCRNGGGDVNVSPDP